MSTRKSKSLYPTYYNHYPKILAPDEIDSLEFQKNNSPFNNDLSINFSRLGGSFIKYPNDLIVYKKVQRKESVRTNIGSYLIAVLIIPKGTEIYSSPDAKKRARQAFVLDILTYKHTDRNDFLSRKIVQSIPRDKNIEVCSIHDSKFPYQLGTYVKPKGGFSLYPEQCSKGIHFYFELLNAINH